MFQKQEIGKAKEGFKNLCESVVFFSFLSCLSLYLSCVTSCSGLMASSDISLSTLPHPSVYCTLHLLISHFLLLRLQKYTHSLLLMRLLIRAHARVFPVAVSVLFFITRRPLSASPWRFGRNPPVIASLAVPVQPGRCWDRRSPR